MSSLAVRIAVILTLLAGTAVGVTPSARADSTAAPPPATILFLGLFHFHNPGLDAVRYEPIDVMRPAEQAYLVGLAERLAAFKPTKVLLEYREQDDEVINQRYAEYLAGRHELGRNEIYQLGFRIARLAGHARVYGFDRPAPPGEDKLWGWMEQGDPAATAKLMALIDRLSQRMQQEHRTLSLQQLLAQENTPAAQRENKGFYMLLNPVGASDGLYYGADSSGSWWHRNLRMYAVVQSHAQPGERVLVIAGSGHTAILRDFLAADPERVEAPVAPFF